MGRTALGMTLGKQGRRDGKARIPSLSHPALGHSVSL